MSKLRLVSLVIISSFGMIAFCNCDNEPNNIPPTCSDGVQNGDETGVDCGGSCADCPTDDPTCSDGVRNGDETGIDCGGSCEACSATPTCSDGIRNGGEEGVDCGGPCDECSGPATCSDGERNGDERGIDCGGSCPNPDCCTNGYADFNLGELGEDCGGSCTEACYSGTVYYVSNDGHDEDNDGLSEDSPWRTIDHVNRQEFAPGDAILFRRGDVWREMLMISSSGTESQRITFASYGDSDEPPSIFGSAAVTSWTNISGNVWMGDQSVTDPSRGAPHHGQSQGSGGWPGGSWFVALDGSVTWGHQEKELGGGFGELQESYDWGWHDGHIYVYSEGNPADTWASVEVSQRSSSIEMPSNNAQSWVTLDGIQMLFTQAKGFFSGYPAMAAQGLTIRNCHVAYVGIKDGLAADCLKVWHSDAVYENNEIHDCGRHGIGVLVMADRGITISNVTIENNHFYNGWHTTGIDIQLIGGSDTMNGFMIRGNLFEGTPTEDLGAEEGHNSNHVWTNPNDGALSDFHFINNVFTYCHGKCLAIQDIDTVTVLHNTFYGVNPTLANVQGQLYFIGDVINVLVRNNIFYNDLNTSSNGDFYSIKLNAHQIPEIDLDYNLYYTTDLNAPMVNVVDQTGVWQTSEWEEYRLAIGWDENSPDPQDPDFVGPPFDLHLSETSPARGEGQWLAEVSTDRDGVSRSDPPCLGAYE